MEAIHQQTIGLRRCIYYEILLLLTQVASDSFATQWTVAFQTPLSMGFSRQ